MKTTKRNGSPSALIAEVERSNAALIARQERASIVAMNRENEHTLKDRAKFALPPAADASLALADGTARVLTAEEQDEVSAAKARSYLERFGDRAGKHGPLASVKRGMLLRVPRDAYLALIQISADVGPRPTSLITELAIVASRCPPARWHDAVAAFQHACGAK